MLGYVKIAKSELKVRDYEIYRGIYCSLCNALGKNYTAFARLLLSYDFAFAAILRLALGNGSCTFSQKRCPLNPAKKCFFCEQKAEIDQCAHAIIIIAYYKLLDNIHDREIGKKIISALLFPAVSLMHKKAVKNAPEIESIVSESIEEQKRIEAKNAGIDESADPSAKALGRIFALNTQGEETDLLYDVGYLTGRLVYILDAVDDLEKDIKTGNYNPLKNEFSSLKNKDERLAFAQRSEKIINLTHSALLEAKDKLQLKRFGEITENILFDGLEIGSRYILKKYKEDSNIPKTFTVE